MASDMDCFLVGSRGVDLDPLPPDQARVLEWCVENIEAVLRASAERLRDATWTEEWLDVLKRARERGFYPNMPPLGFGDPVSYDFMEKSTPAFAVANPDSSTKYCVKN